MLPSVAGLLGEVCAVAKRILLQRALRFETFKYAFLFFPAVGQILSEHAGT